MSNLNYDFNEKKDLTVDLGTRQAQLKKDKEYVSEVKDIDIQRNVPTLYGIGNAVVMKHHVYKENTNGEFDIVSLSQKYFLSKSEQSRFGKMYKALTGNTPEGRVDLAKLIGKKCIVLIDHYENKNGDIFDNISEVKKLNDNFNLNEGTI